MDFLSIKSYFRAGSFLKNLSVVMSGTVFSQALLFAMMPVISRFFTASDFGVFGTFSSILNVLAAIVTLEYTQAIVLSKYQEEALNLFWVSCFSAIVVSGFGLLTGVTLWILFDNVLPIPGYFVILLVVATFAWGINLALGAWAVRVKAFTQTALSQVVYALVVCMVWLSTGWIQLGAAGLVLGVVFGKLLASVNILKVFVADLKLLAGKSNRKDMKRAAYAYRDFPVYAAPNNAMNALSQGLPVLMLGAFYGLEIAGLYAFGVKVIQTPTGVILTPLRQVLFQKASETHNQGGRLLTLYIKTTGGLALLGFLPTVVLFLWAPAIFSWVFGAEWLVAGEYARWLILWVYIGFMNPPSTLFARILRKQRALFVHQCVVLLSRAIVIVLGGLYFTPIVTVILFSLLGVVLNFFIIIWIALVLYRNTRYSQPMSI